MKIKNKINILVNKSIKIEKHMGHVYKLYNSFVYYMLMLYNFAVMKNIHKTKKSAFTLVELVISLALLGIFFTITGIVVGNLVKEQNSQAVERQKIDEIDSVDEFVGKFVSTINISTSDIYFSYNDEKTSESANGHTFYLNYKSYTDRNYYLKFESSQYVQTLSVKKTESLSDESYLYESVLVLKQTFNIVFDYDESLKTLKTIINLSSYPQIVLLYRLECLLWLSLLTN